MKTIQVHLTIGTTLEVVDPLKKMPIAKVGENVGFFFSSLFAQLFQYLKEMCVDYPQNN